MADENTEPEWKAHKEYLDSLEDGYGPYLVWMWDEPKIQELKESIYRKEFLEWAKEWMPQGCSLACCEGVFLNDCTAIAYEAFMAGRDPHLFRNYRNDKEKKQ